MKFALALMVGLFFVGCTSPTEPAPSFNLGDVLNPGCKRQDDGTILCVKIHHPFDRTRR